MALLLRTAAVATAVAVMGMLANPAAPQGAPSASPAPAYKNHTVGGADGWFFNATSNTTSGNYSSWAATETFYYLGDYLIFKTNDNSSVVLTDNSTTYSLCDASEDEGLKTYIYGGGGGGGGGTEETESIDVPLMYEGTTYFFSEADGGAQCQQGMRFEIKVAYGRGLPPDLAHPPPAPKGRILAPPPAGSAFSQGSDGDGVGAGASDYTDGKSAGCRGSVEASSHFLGVAIAVIGVAFLVDL